MANVTAVEETSFNPFEIPEPPAAEPVSAPPVPATAKPVLNLNITESTVCINISFGRMGNTRKLQPSQISVGDAENPTDKRLVKAQKQLFESKEYAAIGTFDGETKRYLQSICLPSPFREGIYLVSMKAVEKIKEYLEGREAKRPELVEAFIAVYEKCKADAETRLGSVFNAADYPMIGQVRKSFYMEWNFVSFATPGKLKEISKGFFEAEQAKASAKWAEATDEVRLLLRASLKELVDHMLERLTPGEDGKAKIIRGSTVTGLIEFLNNFELRDVTNDAQLNTLITSCKQLMSGVDVESIRKNEAVRDGMAAGFKLIQSHLDGMVEEAGRAIEFED